MIPIFWRIWLVKMTHVFDLLVTLDSFLKALDIKRGSNPTCASPISPSTSAWGVNAATESIMTTSIAPLRIRVSTISNACSPESGCEIRTFSRLTPIFRA